MNGRTIVGQTSGGGGPSRCYHSSLLISVNKRRHSTAGHIHEGQTHVAPQWPQCAAKSIKNAPKRSWKSSGGGPSSGLSTEWASWQVTRDSYPSTITSVWMATRPQRVRTAFYRTVRLGLIRTAWAVSLFAKHVADPRKGFRWGWFLDYWYGTEDRDRSAQLRRQRWRKWLSKQSVVELFIVGNHFRQKLRQNSLLVALRLVKRKTHKIQVHQWDRGLIAFDGKCAQRHLWTQNSMIDCTKSNFFPSYCTELK